jgi:hypothetical protein
MRGLDKQQYLQMTLRSRILHFLSMTFTGLKWIEKRKKVFDSAEGKTVSMAFLKPEGTDMYNNGMNNVDITDQLCGTY